MISMTRRTFARAFLQVTQALRVTDSGTRRRFEAPLLLLSLGVLFFAASAELVDSDVDSCSWLLVDEGRMLRKDIVAIIL
jgi:hypothetical protein